MHLKIAAVSVAFLAISGVAHAQIQPNSTPTGAAVPSAQQVTGKAADAHGRDQPQSPANPGNAAESNENAKEVSTPAPNAATAK